jgi:hypothetical protein
MKELTVMVMICAVLTGLCITYGLEVNQQEKHITALEDEIEGLGIVIGEYEREILRDDRLLMGFTHGTWDRECKYRIDPWTQLADGSIRQQLFQECKEK